MLKSSGIVSPTTFSNGGLRRLSNSPGPTEVAMDSVRGSDGQESLKHSEDDEDVPVGAPVHNIANRTLISSGVVIAVLILGWYFFSVDISVYNKWMFSGGQLNFPFPLYTTSLHMLVNWAISATALACIPRLRPPVPNVEKPSFRTTIAQMQPRFYATHVTPCAVSTGLDIGLGNTSLKFVTLTFFTMVKSSTLGFVLTFAIFFGLEKFSWKLAGILGLMTGGVILMVSGETEFSGIGFGLLMAASAFSGLRWSLTQMLLKNNPVTSNPIASLFYLTPVMFLTLFVLACFVEGPGSFYHGCVGLMQDHGALGPCILLFPGVLAFAMTSVEFALLQRTSVVTLSVAGIFKEVLTITAGGYFFEEKLTPINISGASVTIVAIAFYNWMRFQRMRSQALREAQERRTEENAPMLAQGA